MRDWAEYTSDDFAFLGLCTVFARPDRVVIELDGGVEGVTFDQLAKISETLGTKRISFAAEHQYYGDPDIISIVCLRESPRVDE